MPQLIVNVVTKTCVDGYIHVEDVGDNLNVMECKSLK